VKLRGYRIDLGEIETVLNRHPAVDQTVVMLREIGVVEKVLVAYVVPAGDISITVKALRQHLMPQLPSYMVPSKFIVLTELPLTPNGKIDRKALPTYEPQQEDLPDHYIAPRNSIEERLAGLWQEVLAVERVGVYDNFFDLGGHSLLATQLVSRIRDAFTVEIKLRQLLEQPTVNQLAAIIEQIRPDDNGIREPVITPVARIPRRMKQPSLKSI
jgi:acyl carrier protein